MIPLECFDRAIQTLNFKVFSELMDSVWALMSLKLLLMTSLLMSTSLLSLLLLLSLKWKSWMPRRPFLPAKNLAKKWLQKMCEWFSSLHCHKTLAKCNCERFNGPWGKILRLLCSRLFVHLISTLDSHSHQPLMGWRNLQHSFKMYSGLAKGCSLRIYPCW